MSGRKLARVTAKGYGTLLSYAEADENATIMERLKDSKTVGRQRYHMECRRDLFNKYSWITVQLTRATEARKICTQKDTTHLHWVQFYYWLQIYKLTFRSTSIQERLHSLQRTRSSLPKKSWNCKKEIPNSWQFDCRLIEAKPAQECKGSQWRLECWNHWAPGRNYCRGGRGSIVSFSLQSSFRYRWSLFKVQRCMKENWWGASGRFLSAMRMVRYRTGAWGNDTWRGPRKASVIWSVTR